MEAMILAAGLGTRLRPLTDRIPKALIEVAGVPMLERVARRLIAAGATRLIVNVHAHPDQIRDYIAEHHGFGVEVLLSEERERRLETGGGLKHAAPLFRKEKPFLLHNVDILTDLPLETLYREHLRTVPLATLAVREAESDRYLLFDQSGAFCGYAGNGEEHLIREPKGEYARLDFCGVHVLSPRIFDLMRETGSFSIIDVYVRLAREGERIQAFRVHGATWIDIGTPEALQRARQIAGEKRL